MDSPLRLGRRHALHAVHPTFELQARENAAPGNLGDDFLVSAGRPLARRQHLDLPALRLGVFDIHAEQIAGEQRRLIAACSAPHLQNGVAIVGCVLRKQRDSDRPGHRLRLRFGGSEFSAGQCAHFRVEIGVLQHAG